MSQSHYKEHARSAVERKFHDTVIEIEDKSRTNDVFLVDLYNGSKKKVKYHTFKWHPSKRFLGGAYAQKYLAEFTDVVPKVYGIYHKDPLETVHTSWFVTEYSPGETTGTFHLEDFTRESSKGIASALGKTLAKMHNVTVQSENEFPIGQITWNKNSSEFMSEGDTWEDNIKKIAQSRYNSYNSQHSPIDRETVSTLFNSVVDDIEESISNNITPVLSNMDYRPGNMSYTNLHSRKEPTKITGVFDWDRAMYGDWQYGLAIGEFFLINTAQNESNRIDLQKEYRQSYFEELNYDLTFNLESYKTYIGLQYLQQCRSFNFWYKDRNKNWIDSQRVLTENHINKYINNTLILPHN